MIGYDLPLYLYIPTINMSVRLESSTTERRIAELTMELEVARKDRDEQQDTLNKEITAVECIKNELKTKMSKVTIEKTELTKHLRYISKSRQELEKTLTTELQLVEKTRYDLQQVVKESNKLQKQKEENKVLMSEIERITKATSKERKELESETYELKKFEDEIQQLKQSNEVTRQSLEQEKKQLTEFASEMLTKKSILMESKSEIETQFQNELEELENDIQTRKMMHEQDLGKVAKHKVMSWRDKKAGEDIQSLINSRIDAKLKASASLESTDKEARKEIERLKEEIELVKTRDTPRPKQRHRTTHMKSPTDDSEDLREEIRHLTEKLEMMDQQQQQQVRYRDYPTQRYVDPRMTPGHSSRLNRYSMNPANDQIRKGPPPRIPSRNSDRRKSYSRYEERDDIDSGLYNRRYSCGEYRDNYDHTRREMRSTQSPPVSMRERHLPSHLDMRSPF